MFEVGIRADFIGEYGAGSVVFLVGDVTLNAEVSTFLSLKLVNKFFLRGVYTFGLRSDALELVTSFDFLLVPIACFSSGFAYIVYKLLFILKNYLLF